MSRARASGMIWDVFRIWLLLTLATLLAAILLRPAPTQADDDLNHAGLVVRDGAGRLTYAWVPFPEDEIDGIELLERSGIPVVKVGFGALGEGVCSIAGQGCDIAECRRNVCQAGGANAPYWQYFQQNAANPSHWDWLALGPSASKVNDGEVFGWSWTASEPHLPALPPPEIARLAGASDEHVAEPAVRTILPQGVPPVSANPAPDTAATAAAAGIVAAIGLAAALLVARSRHEAAA